MGIGWYNGAQAPSERSTRKIGQARTHTLSMGLKQQAGAPTTFAASSTATKPAREPAARNVKLPAHLAQPNSVMAAFAASIAKAAKKPAQHDAALLPAAEEGEQMPAQGQASG